MLWIGLAFGLALLAAASARTGRPLGRRAAICLRVVVPSWRFFDRIVPAPRLLYRVHTAETGFGPWQPLSLDDGSRCWMDRGRSPPLSALWFNPRGNLRLAYYGLLEQLTDDLAELTDGDADAAERLVSYALVRALVRQQLPRPLLAVPGLQYQFKLRQRAESATSAGEEEDIVISGLHNVG